MKIPVTILGYDENIEYPLALAKKYLKKHIENSIREPDLYPDICQNNVDDRHKSIAYKLIETVIPSRVMFRVLDMSFIAHKEVAEHTDYFGQDDDEVTILWTLANRSRYSLTVLGQDYLMKTSQITLFDHESYHAVLNRVMERNCYVYQLAIALRLDLEHLSACLAERDKSTSLRM